MKKYLGVTLISICILAVLAACSSDDQSSNQNASDNDSNGSIEPANAEESNEQNNADEKIAFPDEDLQKKDEGKSIEALQKALNEIGYDISADGSYDDETTRAITDLQIQESVQITGVYDEETKDAASDLLNDEEQIDAGNEISIKDDDEETDAGTPVNNNPYDQLGLVNKEHALPDDFDPEDLTVPDVRFPFDEDLPKKQLREVAADALEKMFEAGDEEGMDLFAQSGYRPFDRQDAIFASNVEQNGEEEANKYSARPGESEHQTGLTMDITSPEVDYDLNTDFGDTDEGEWVEDHAAEFGFIIRYPEDKEDITEYQYEPWHLRYVGEQAAQEITEKGLSLEEYLDD